MNKQLKQLATTLRQLGVKVDPRVWIVLGLLLPVVVAAALWIWHKRKKAEAPPEEGAAPVLPAAPKANPRKLRAVWGRFLEQLPRLYRRSILRFHPFIVFGQAGSGKSTLIDGYTDWRRQEKQFIGSIVDDPNLQIYLGSRALLFEVPAPLTLDSSSHARRLLLKLFRPLFRRRRPAVVLVVDLMRLVASTPDAIRNFADTLRGKINLLMEIHRAPIEVRVALTHLDQVEGFPELARFLEQQRLPSVLKLDPSQDQDYAVEGALQEAFAGFDRLLPLALTSVPADDFLKVVACLREMPKQISALRAFLPSLMSQDALGRRPQLSGIYLASTQGGGTGSNPFELAKQAGDELPNPRRMHRMAAFGIALAGTCFFAFSYMHERGLWTPSRTAMFSYSTNRAPEREPTLREQVIAFRDHSEHDALMRVLPGFFSEGEGTLDGELTHAIRDRFLVPGLDRAMYSDWAHRKSLYFLGLLYATRDNDLGKLILHQADNWAESTGLDRQLIVDYVLSARAPYAKKPELDRLPTHIASSAANDPQPWILYFLRVQRAIAGGSVSANELADLQLEAGRLLEALGVIERFEDTGKVLHDLDETTGYGFASIYQPYLKDVQSRDMFGGTLPDVKQALQLIRSARIDPGPSSSLLLADLCEKLKLVLQQKAAHPDAVFSMELGDQAFRLKAADWEQLVRNSAAREQVLAFIGGNADGKRSIFFSAKDATGAATMMNAGNHGDFLFTGKAALPDRYTRSAFDRNVRPVIGQLNTLLGQLTLGPDERRLLEDFVYREMVSYAGDYADAIDAYYHAYGVKAESPEAVQLLIKEMLRPDSPFRELLRTIASNTQLDLDEKNHFLQPMSDALAKYAAIGRVMADKGSGALELDSYQSLLDQLLQTLHPAPAATAPAPAPAAKADAAAAPQAAAPIAGLEDMLSPTGKISLRILQGQKDSYWQLVHDWLANVGISEELCGPFVAPVDALYGAGLHEIEGQVSEVWNHQILTQLDGLLTSFPFDPGATHDAKPEQLTEYFHPLTGKFQDLRHRFIDPISQKLPDGWTFRVGAKRVVAVPDGMYELINHVDRLADALWDAQGKPQPLKIAIAPVPFSAHSSGSNALTLVYLSSGTNALFNFNQQPQTKVIELDWTHAKRAQIGLELTNTISQEKTYPPAVVTDDSPWSLLHLLALGTRMGGNWGWIFRYGKDNEQATMVSFSLDTDPWRLFALRPAVRRSGRNWSRP